MQTLQNNDRAFESHVAHPGEYAASTSTNGYNFSSNIPYLFKQSKGNLYNSSHNCTPYPTTKKRLILSKRVYSTRTRGRSGPLQSLARKLGRFKVRAVIVDDIASEESNRKR